VTRSRTATRDRFLAGARIGDYVVDAELRSEETGVVYQATHVVLPRKVALKVMHAQSAWLRSVAIQMLREACLLEALHHPGIPRVYECGVLSDRRPWTAFEHADGTTLGEQLDAGSMSLVDVVLVLRDVADLLTHAHSRGVVHRSLTADAILRTPERTFPVCVERWDNALTLDTEVRVELDTRDDVLALGAIAFRALTGVMPDRAVPTLEVYPAAPHELASLLDAMLVAEASQRPSSQEVRDRARWLAATLEPLALDHARWTPPRGLTQDAVPVVTDDGGFSVRISPRTRTS
jgi:serine/threonine protein kinase